MINTVNEGKDTLRFFEKITRYFKIIYKITNFQFLSKRKKRRFQF